MIGALRFLFGTTLGRPHVMHGIRVVRKEFAEPKGRDELRAGARPEDVVEVRRPGAGRRRLEDAEPRLLEALESLVDPVMHGDPESPLCWTSKSTRKLADELQHQGYTASPQKVGQLLHGLGYSLQGTHKTTGSPSTSMDDFPYGDVSAAWTVATPVSPTIQLQGFSKRDEMGVVGHLSEEGFSPGRIIKFVGPPIEPD